MDRKDLKRKAKINLKTHYLFYLVLCILLATFTSIFSDSLSFIKFRLDNGQVYYEDALDMGSLDDVFNHILNEDIEAGKEEALRNKEKYAETDHKVFGRKNGIIASWLNYIGSGNILISITSGINSIIKSEKASIAVLVFLAVLLKFSWWFVFENILVIGVIRMFLEGRTYRDLDILRLSFLRESGNLINAALAMALKYILTLLWSLTIVGGFIKYYSYFLVPYILAENPSIKPREAINLSREMMDGHKWELFLIDASFILWRILDGLSFGLIGVLYVNPYKMCTNCEFYAVLRNTARPSELNDFYLYEKADTYLIRKAYPEYQDLIRKLPKKTNSREEGLIGFLGKNFGLSIGPQDIRNKMAEERRIDNALESLVPIIDGDAYPIKLSSFYKENIKRLPRLDLRDYMRTYSLSSLAVIFFVFSFIGWIWEISLRLITDGILINRGSLHGPWIPIYGFGGLSILLILYRYRNNIYKHFVYSMVVAGILEYSASLMLETIHHGKKWWDYSGYFLNLNGRVTLEGLIAFAIGGILAACFVGPLIDDFLKKRNKRNVRLICILIGLLFLADTGYSTIHPNQGKGITDYK